MIVPLYLVSVFVPSLHREHEASGDASDVAIIRNLFLFREVQVGFRVKSVTTCSTYTLAAAAGRSVCVAWCAVFSG